MFVSAYWMHRKMSLSTSPASSPPRSTPHVPCFRSEELEERQEHTAVCRKLFYEEGPPTVRAWRNSSSGRGDDDGKREEAGVLAHELKCLREQLEQERSLSRTLQAKVDGFRSQAWQAQSDMKALREQHQHTLVGMEQLCIQLGKSKQNEVHAERMEASLRTLQAMSQRLSDARPGDPVVEALRSGLSSALSHWADQQEPEQTARAETPRAAQHQEAVDVWPAVAKPVWDGQYLHSPPRGTTTTPSAASLESDATDLLPPPPSKKCWEWPMSKPEKQVRVAMMDAQLWRYEQTGLIEQVEMLQGLCAQHGIAPNFEEMEVGSTASSESV